MRIVRRLRLPLVFVGGAAAAAFALRKWLSRLHEEKVRQKKALQVWEGEGGHLESSVMTSRLSRP
jgi:hypothetical protein